jgi:succinoglycan biosynthesis transport protein ExoP
VLDHEARSAPVHTLVVTSSVPGEGKSTVAAALASAIARLDARVLLVDADLRHPTVASLFGLEQKPGLAELLRGEAEFPEAVSSIRNVPGLYVVPTSGIVDTGDLLARNLHSVLQRARSGFDVVIVDSPPLLAGDDSGTIATQADAVLLVVANGVETRRLGEAARILDNVGVRVIGALLNRAPVPTFGYTYRTTVAEGRSSTS